MPSSSKVQQQILRLLPCHVTGTVYELGSGWGGLALALGDVFPQAQVYGYELSPAPYFFSLLRRFYSSLSNVIFKRCDFFDEDLSDANIIVVYLFPEAMEKLAVKFKELPAGTMIISSTFTLPGWTPKHVTYIDDLYHTPVYLYQVGV